MKLPLVCPSINPPLIDAKKLKPICYDPVAHTYVGMGEKVGNAFQDGKQLK